MSALRMLALACLLVGSWGCYGLRGAVGMSMPESRIFSYHPTAEYDVKPIAHVETRVHGVSVFGFPAKRMHIDDIREEYLTNDRRYFTGFQVLAGTYQTIIFDLFFTVSYLDMRFDVVEVEELR